MRAVQDYIARRQAAVGRHAFFVDLRPDPSLERALSFAPPLAFWVMSFQDVIRLNQERFQDPVLREIFARHREDDAHDPWFLHDLKLLRGSDGLDLAWLFGPECQPIRDATWALAAEVFRMTDDRLRVVYVMVVESASHLFFERVARHVDESGHAEKLKFFSRSHLDVEEHHDIFENPEDRQKIMVDLPPELRDEALALVDRCYLAFEAMSDALHRYVRPLGEHPSTDALR